MSGYTHRAANNILCLLKTQLRQTVAGIKKLMSNKSKPGQLGSDLYNCLWFHAAICQCFFDFVLSSLGESAQFWFVIFDEISVGVTN